MLARILVVEDNPANLELILYLLTAFGYVPLAAIDGESGVETAKRELPDLILCDIQMPGIDGYEVAQQVRAIPNLKSIPLIAVTAFAMVGDRERVLDSGFDGYLSKPITPETFISDIEGFLRPEQRALPRSRASRHSPAGPAKRGRRNN